VNNHTRHTIIRHLTLSSSKSGGIQTLSKDASDIVAIIPMPTVLPVWPRNTPVKPVWSWLGDALASLHAHGCLWPVAGQLLSLSVNSVLRWRIFTHWSFGTLQHHMHSITVTEGVDHKGRALSHTHLRSPQHALRHTPTSYKLQLKTNIPRHTVLDWSTPDPMTTHSNAWSMLVITWPSDHLASHPTNWDGSLSHGNDRRQHMEL